jgi:hypothetical protein
MQNSAPQPSNTPQIRSPIPSTPSTTHSSSHQSTIQHSTINQQSTNKHQQSITNHSQIQTPKSTQTEQRQHQSPSINSISVTSSHSSHPVSQSSKTSINVSLPSSINLDSLESTVKIYRVLFPNHKPISPKVQVYQRPLQKILWEKFKYDVTQN